MIKIGEAVFHPDPSVVSREELNKSIDQMRQSFYDFKRDSNITGVNPSHKTVSDAGTREFGRLRNK